MQQPQRAYKIRRMSEGEYKRRLAEMQRAYEELRADLSFKSVPFPIAGRSLLLKVASDGHDGKAVFIMDAAAPHRALGVVDFFQSDPGPLSAKFSFSDFYNPHATLHPELRGLGVVQAVYDWMLTKGCILFADGHTDDAGRMWDRLSAKWPGDLIVYDTKAAVIRAPRTPAEVKTAVRFLLGAGRTYKNIIPQGWTAVFD